MLVSDPIQLLLHVFSTFPFRSTVEISNLTAALCIALTVIAGGENTAYTILLGVADDGG